MGEVAGLSVRVHRSASPIAIVEAAGEIDLASVGELGKVLREAIERGPVVLDAAKIAFCDSAGLHSLLNARRAALERGESFRLAAPSPALIRVLELAGAFEVFEVFPDLETALKD